MAMAFGGAVNRGRRSSIGGPRGGCFLEPDELDLVVPAVPRSASLGPHGPDRHDSVVATLLVLELAAPDAPVFLRRLKGLCRRGRPFRESPGVEAGSNENQSPCEIFPPECTAGHFWPPFLLFARLLAPRSELRGAHTALPSDRPSPPTK